MFIFKDCQGRLVETTLAQSEREAYCKAAFKLGMIVYDVELEKGAKAVEVTLVEKET